jgi:hypothetical protein
MNEITITCVGREALKSCKPDGEGWERVSDRWVRGEGRLLGYYSEGPLYERQIYEATFRRVTA